MVQLLLLLHKSLLLQLPQLLLLLPLLLLLLQLLLRWRRPGWMLRHKLRIHPVAATNLRCLLLAAQQLFLLLLLPRHHSKGMHNTTSSLLDAFQKHGLLLGVRIRLSSHRLGTLVLNHRGTTRGQRHRRRRCSTCLRHGLHLTRQLLRISRLKHPHLLLM